jgi:Mg-chelatase subunit ChlD
MWRVAMIVGFQILLSATAHGQLTQKESRAIVLVIDKSGSMRDQNRMTYAKELAKSIARQLIDADYFGVIAFDLNPAVILDLEEVSLLRQKDLIDKQIDSLKPAGQTHFLPALLEARRQLEPNGATKKHIVFLSDGATRGSYGDLIDLVISMKAKLAIRVSAIGVGADADIRLMRRIGNYGGGSFVLFCNPSDLPQITLDGLLSGRTSLGPEGDQKCPPN